MEIKKCFERFQCLDTGGGNTEDSGNGNSGDSGSGNAGNAGDSGSGNAGNTGDSGSGNTGDSGTGNTGNTGDSGNGNSGGSKKRKRKIINMKVTNIEVKPVDSKATKSIILTHERKNIYKPFIFCLKNS